MQSVLDQWNAVATTAVPPALIGRVAPTRAERIDLRGVFTFPIEQYRAQVLQSLSAKSRAFDGYTQKWPPNAPSHADRTPVIQHVPANYAISPKISGANYRLHGNQGDPSSA